jgi:hypothetical protein
LPNLGSNLIASSASFKASGSAASLVYAAARLLYPRASLGSRLIASVYDLTASAKLPAYIHNIVNDVLNMTAMTHLEEGIAHFPLLA